MSKPKHNPEEYISKKYNSWTIVRQLDPDNNPRMYEVRCDCGFIRSHSLSTILYGASKSCASCGHRKHLRTRRSKEYTGWK